MLEELVPVLITVSIVAGMAILSQNILPLLLDRIKMINSIKKDENASLLEEDEILNRNFYLQALANANSVTPEEIENLLKMIFFNTNDEFDYRNSILYLILIQGHYSVKADGIVSDVRFINSLHNDTILNQFTVLRSIQAIKFINDRLETIIEVDSGDMTEFVLSTNILLWANSFVSFIQMSKTNINIDLGNGLFYTHEDSANIENGDAYYQQQNNYY